MKEKIKVQGVSKIYWKRELLPKRIKRNNKKR